MKIAVEHEQLAIAAACPFVRVDAVRPDGFFAFGTRHHEPEIPVIRIHAELIQKRAGDLRARRRFDFAFVQRETEQIRIRSGQDLDKVLSVFIGLLRALIVAPLLRRDQKVRSAAVYRAAAAKHRLVRIDIGITVTREMLAYSQHAIILHSLGIHKVH